MKRILENTIPGLMIALALIAYDHYGRSKPIPAGAPDPAVIKLGSAYVKSLQDAAAATLESTAGGAWTSTSEAIAANRKQFDLHLKDAWKPVAADMTRRFGAPSDQPATPATAAALRAFCRDFAEGVRQGGR